MLTWQKGEYRDADRNQVPVLLQNVMLGKCSECFQLLSLDLVTCDSSVVV